MNTARLSSNGPVGDIILEVLSTLLAPDLRGRVLAEALELEGSEAIPEDRARARAFVEGPLRLVVKRRVGDMMSKFLIDHLEPAFVHIDSFFDEPDFEETDPHGSPTERPSGVAARHSLVPQSVPQRPGPRRVGSGTVRRQPRKISVVVASVAPEAVTAMYALLPTEVDVFGVTRPDELLQAVEAMRTPWWLLVDLCQGPFEVSALSWMAPTVADGCRVLVWGELPPNLAHLVKRKGWSILEAGPSWMLAAESLSSALP